MASSSVCPVCQTSPTKSVLVRERLPVMQNYVYRDQTAAVESSCGRMDLRACPRCGFVANGAFDAALMRYDEGYDNAVPSAIFKTYYEEIAAYLYRRYRLAGGLVIDVGCGKGEFIRTLCEAHHDVRAIGIDPSCRAGSALGGRLHLIQDVFSAERITEKPSLVVCRHVVEHIDRPVAFLSSMRTGLKAFDGVPVFIEVPDLDWIVTHRAFWDFCYEHCNYFSTSSLSAALVMAGFTPTANRTAFGDQYLWMECETMTLANAPAPHADDLPARLAAYATAEAQQIAHMRDRLAGLRRAGHAVVVWGMATKGVIFCNLVDPYRALVDRCIDVNPGKQRAFVPVTGHRIDPPEVLRDTPGKEIAVIVMNENYRNEIQSLGATIEPHRVIHYMGASGSPLSSTLEDH